MRKDSRTPSPRSLRKLRSVPRVSGFTFPSSMQTSTCRDSWRVSWARKSGWLPGWAKLADNPAAGPSELPLRPMEGWAADPGRYLHIRSDFSPRIWLPQTMVLGVGVYLAYELALAR